MSDKDPTLTIEVDASAKYEAMRIALERTLHTQQYYWTDNRTYRITIEDISPEPEEERWWYWEYGAGWIVSAQQGDAPAFVTEHAARVWGTKTDREEKVQLLKDAQRKAGKP